MTDFVEIGAGNTVMRFYMVPDTALLDENGVSQETQGQSVCKTVFGGNWLQTFSDGRRKNYAGIGYIYDPTRDAFIPPKPFASWLLNEDTCQWQAPIPMLQDGKKYSWDEPTLSWKEMTDGKPNP